MELELRHLRTLVAVQDAGTITDAAIDLGLSQPAVSRSLAQLEQVLGVQLVARSSRELALTEAGARTYDAAVAALRAVAAVQDAASGVVPPLRVGFSWAAFGERTTVILRSWRQEHPEVPLELRRVDRRDAGLRRGAVDVAIIRGDFSDPLLQTVELAREGRMAAVAAGHLLAGRVEVRLDDLADETLALTPTTGTTTTGLWPSAHRPQRIVVVGNVDEWLASIAAGEAIGVTPAATAFQHPLPGVVYLPLVDAPDVPVQLAWPLHAPHPAVLALRDLLSRLLS
ncbi:LysR family transcriptional regulator [Nakamurella sp. YIM 132087]|uniref:LysR family transcriptional regulator n=1 Tax=Nakamurella alba TaxID=2665158 RepID=A0A7K1FFQ5_9ACTN|nr:LysR family transcriptional regulator [Nakamurella alba]MTD12955.1 LysR family transcriptional regulator [Nakamurella alba]